MKRKLLTFLTSCFLGLGALSMGMIESNKKEIKGAKAATPNVYIARNGNCDIKHKSAESNPYTWNTSDNTNDDYGYLRMSNLSTTTNPAVTTTTSSSEGTFTIEEKTDTTNFYVVYIPLTVYITNMEYFTYASCNLTFTLSLSGCRPEAYGGFYVIGFGDNTNTDRINANPGTNLKWNFPSGSSYNGSKPAVASGQIVERVFNSVFTTTNTNSITVNSVRTSNTSGDTATVPLYHCGVMIGCRKSTSDTVKHRFKGTIKVTASSLSTNRYAAYDDNWNFYATLAEAYTSTNSGKRHLLQNITITSDFTFNKTYGLDLNGWTIIVSNGYKLINGSGNDITFYGPGSINGETAQGVIENNGYLTIGSGVQLKNSSSSGYGVKNNRVLYLSGTINGPSIGVYNATANSILSVEGGIIYSSTNDAINLYKGEVYISGGSSIRTGSSSKNSIYVSANPNTDAKIYTKAYGSSTSYQGVNNITIRYYKPIETAGYVAIYNCTSSICDKINIDYNSYSFGLEFYYNSSTYRYESRKITRTVTYSLTNCTGNGSSTIVVDSTYNATITANTGYKLTNDCITVVHGSTTWTNGTQYTFTPATGAFSIATYYVGSNITVTITAVAKTNADYAQEFVDSYMRMSYTTSGQCYTYYGPAKAAFNALDSGVRQEFLTNATFADAKARLIAWSAANGETLNTTTNTFSINPRIVSQAEAMDNSIVLIVVVASVLGLASLCFVLKKKHN